MRSITFILVVFLLPGCDHPSEKQMQQSKLNIAAYDSVALKLRMDDDSLSMGTMDQNDDILDHDHLWDKAVICRDSFKAYHDEENYKKWSVIADSLGKMVHELGEVKLIQ